ncbi:hypothetical protein TRFO_22300 [Tritrichomonas foetus]|uniref:RING-type domain-containing protein n=1 Tax=Tritrichomonas foetus TaxID=1144522 RepID=A0A1J4KC20_9EUKA|nr:hypothetical protein TRFO_22300 [Tritrichomonas foetus]|eukprot:OHT08967.1 hypothetical protein TRFO_22300 [Tritrichomonas foetus]
MFDDDPLFYYSSLPVYKHILKLYLQIQRKFLEKQTSRNQLMDFFNKSNQDSLMENLGDLALTEINDECMDFDIIDFLSNRINEKIQDFLDIQTFESIQEMKNLFAILFNFSIYPIFKLNETNFKEHELLKPLTQFCSIIFDEINENCYQKMLPFSSAQILLELSVLKFQTSKMVQEMIKTESIFFAKDDEKNTFNDNFPPEICCNHREFMDIIKTSNEFFIQNSQEVSRILPQFFELKKVFDDMTNQYNLLKQLNNEYMDVFLSCFPISSFYEKLNNEQFSLFIRPRPIVINDVLGQDISQQTLHYYQNKITEIQEQNNKLENELKKRTEFELYFQNKYKIIPSQSNYQIIFNNFSLLIDYYNRIIENIDVFDESITNLIELSEVFNDKENHDLAISVKTVNDHLDKQIKSYKNSIQERQEQIEIINDEISKIQNATLIIQQNKKMIENQVSNPADCALCRIERKYVLTTCGHTFCDSCYQNLCLQQTLPHFCPFCNISFTFNDIIKINWSSEIIVISDSSSDED